MVQSNAGIDKLKISNNTIHVSPSYASIVTFLGGESKNLQIKNNLLINERKTAGSTLLDAGVDVGYTFLGNAPDIGAIEFGEGAST